MAPDPALASMRKIATRADVYPPAEDSFLLVDALAEIWRDELATARPTKTAAPSATHPQLLRREPLSLFVH